MTTLFSAAIYFTRVNDETETPVELDVIDEELRRALEKPFDNTVISWADVIGFKLANGRTFKQSKKEFQEAMSLLKVSDEYHIQQYLDYIEINDWLSQHFTVVEGIKCAPR